VSIKFIEDKEFDLSKPENQDLLGTKPYAETLFEVIKESKGKQNIGLFGGWGSGKSTIVKTLEKFIAKHNKKNGSNKIAYFKYDAWKYSNDDFRRSFIKSLNKEFKVLKENAINEILYNETTTQDTSKTKVGINYPQIILLLITAIILLLVIGKFILPSIKSDDIKSILVLVSLLASFLFYISRDTFRIIPFTIKQSRLIEPERFEETFQLIVNKIFGINKNWMDKFKDSFKTSLDHKKIVIVIDNLDRCDNDNLKETLITMKNFLENENVIFLLPVDENGVTSFLDKNTEDAEEYLRKIFHQIIRLKKFTPKELVDFTKKLNKKYNLKLSNKAIWLICQEFTTNPRKIIQFLNNLQTEKDLIIRQIDEGYINLEFDQQANDFLIKLLIIKQEWNPLYKKLLDDINYLNKINIGLKNIIKQKKLNYILNTGKQEIELTRDQKRFFKRNMEVHFQNVEPFILNIDRDKDVPDELKGYIENGELDEICELLSIDFEKDIPQETITLLLNQIESVFDYNSNKFDDYNFIALPVSEILNKLVKYEIVKKEIKHNFKNLSFISRIYSDNQFSNLISNLSLGRIKEYCESANWFYNEIKLKSPYDRLLSYLNESLKPNVEIKGIHVRTKAFLEIFKNDTLLISGLSKNLSNKIIDKPDLLNSYDIFKTNLDVAKSILNDDFFYEMLENLNEEKIENKESIDRLIYLTDKFIEEDYLTEKSILTKYSNYYVKKVKNEYVTIPNTTPNKIFKLYDEISKLKNLIPKSELEDLELDETVIAGINAKLNVAYNASLDDDEVEFYIAFFNLVWEYMCIDSEFCSDENDAKYFNLYFAYNDFDKMSLAINEIYIKEVNKFNVYNWNFFDPIINKLKIKKSTDYMKTLMLMYDMTSGDKGLSDTQKDSMIDSLILLYIHWKSYKNTRSIIKDWLIKVLDKEKSLYERTIENLDYSNLEKYVYNIYNLDNNDLIANSFELYISQISEYPKFRKFLNHLYKNYDSSFQFKILQKYIELKGISGFDWLISTKKYIHKQALNDLVKQYVNNYYNDKKLNSDYLKNLLKLEINEIFLSTKRKISELLEGLYRPSIYHRTKISKLKRKLNL